MEERIPTSTQPSRPSASMVELKAELFKKKQEFQKDRAANFNAVKGRKLDKISLKKKSDVWDQKNPGVSARAQRDVQRSEQDEDVLLKSRTILERKSKIYDAITSSATIPDEDGSEGYLVDFQKKSVDAIVEERERMRREEEDEAERRALEEPIPEPENSDEEWVDYTDSLGRSRRCLRKDLKDIKKDDKYLARSLDQKRTETNEKSEGKGATDSSDLHLMSSDMYREKMRQKWEDEANQLVEKGQEEIHYSNVQFDEIRNHGVGFYQFSKDQHEREAQMEKLKNLREETKVERSRKEKIQDKRKAMLEARLAKVKERRKLKTKEPLTVNEETGINSKLSEADKEELRKDEELKKKKEEAEKAAEEARRKFVREWDEKKKPVSSWLGDKYADSRRSEREAEFAPPSLYFNETSSSSKSSISSSNFGNRNIVSEPFKANIQSNGGKHQGNVLQTSLNSSSLHSPLSTDLCSVSEDTKNIPVDSIPLPSFPEGMGGQRLPSVATSPSSNLDHSHQSEATLRQVPPNQLETHQHTHSSKTDQTHYDAYAPQPTPVAPPYDAMQHQLFWQQQQPPPQQPPPQQQQLPQQQHWFSQPTTVPLPGQPPLCHVSPGQDPHHLQVQAEQSLPAQTNSMQMNAPCSSKSAPTSYFSNDNCKRSPSQEEALSAGTPKKPKVPKSSIVDNRFMLNSESSSDLHALSTVQAVPYQPGSFTEARFKHATETISLSEENETLNASEKKAQISGGPMLYTAEQQQKQLDLLKEDKDSNAETNEKVEEFLKSIRNETR